MGQAAQHQAAIMRRLGCLQSQLANSTALAGSRAVCHSGAEHDRLAFNLSTFSVRPNTISPRSYCSLLQGVWSFCHRWPALSSGMAALAWHPAQGPHKAYAGV